MSNFNLSINNNVGLPNLIPNPENEDLSDLQYMFDDIFFQDINSQRSTPMGVPRAEEFTPAAGYNSQNVNSNEYEDLTPVPSPRQCISPLDPFPGTNQYPNLDMWLTLQRSIKQLQDMMNNMQSTLKRNDFTIQTLSDQFHCHNCCSNAYIVSIACPRRCHHCSKCNKNARSSHNHKCGKNVFKINPTKTRRKTKLGHHKFPGKVYCDTTVEYISENIHL